jgi:hypothetical protein
MENVFLIISQLERMPVQFLLIDRFTGPPALLIDIVQDFNIRAEKLLPSVALNQFAILERHHDILSHNPSSLAHIIYTEPITGFFFLVNNYSLSPPTEITLAAQIRQRPLGRAALPFNQRQLIAQSDQDFTKASPLIKRLGLDTTLVIITLGQIFILRKVSNDVATCLIYLTQDIKQECLHGFSQ